MDVLEWASARGAAWPVDVTDEFEAIDLAALATELNASEQTIDARRSDVVNALYECVPRAPDRQARAALLSAKRAVHRGSAAFATDAVLPSVAHHDLEDRQRLARRRAEFEQAYERVLDRQCEHLASIAATNEFRDALRSANPRVAAAWDRTLVRGSDNRARTHRLENTIARYLLRASGRATPYARWTRTFEVGPDDDFVWSRDRRHATARAIEEQQRFWGGMAEAYRVATIALLTGEPVPPPIDDAPDTMRFVLGMRPIDPDVVDQAIARWESELAPVAACPSADVTIEGPVSAGPAGTVLITPGDDQIWLGPSRPHPGVLVQEGTVADSVRSLYRSWPVPVVALRGGDAPPAALDVDRPVLTDDELVADTASEVRIDPPFLIQNGRRAVLAYDSTTIIGMRDPMARALYWLSSSLGWEVPAFGFPALPAERATWKHLPRLVLPCGAVLSPRRWTIDGLVLGALVSASGSSRYLAWRALADERGWPRRVAVRWDPHPLGPALTFPASSPLAVRAVLDALPDNVERFIVSEVPPPASLGPDARAHVMEIGAIWHDSTFWASAR